MTVECNPQIIHRHIHKKNTTLWINCADRFLPGLSKNFKKAENV